MRVLLVITVVALALCVGVKGHKRQEQIPPNRCLPGQSCFPSRQTLAEFATTLAGSVLTPADPQYSQIVSMTNTRLVRHPYIVVMAGDAADVQKAMLFARKHQLMLTSQSSSQEATGRSTFDGSLQINLSNLRGVMSVSDVPTTRSEGGEITAAAGTTWDTVFSQARQVNRDVVSASNLQLTLGATVGDGGIGPLVRIYGLVSDSMLEAQIVTADGNLVTVTEYNVVVDYGEGLVRRTFDRSFFASLASGGIGTWGVVVSYTFKLYVPPPSVVTVEARYRLWESGEYVGADTLKFVVGVFDQLPTQWGGYIYVAGDTSETEIATKGELMVNLMYYGSWKANADYDFINNLLTFDATDALISVVSTNLTSALDFERRQPSDATRTSRYYTFNVLLQTEKLSKVRDAEEELNNALLFVLNNPTVESLFLCRGTILGGNLANEPRNTSYVSSNLRSASASLDCALQYPGKGEKDSYFIDRALDFAEMFERFSEGRYRMFAEEDLPEWKHAYHGSHHGHLIETKLKYDIDNYLWCHNCVGSDFRVKCNGGRNGNGRQASRIMDVLTTGHGNGGKGGDGHDARYPFISQMSQHH